MTALVAVIVANVVVSLLGFHVLRDGKGRRGDACLFIPYQVARGENGAGWLLAHFAHAGFAHLAFNMLALYSFGGTVLAALAGCGKKMWEEESHPRRRLSKTVRFGAVPPAGRRGAL
jgi:Rhomboid family